MNLKELRNDHGELIGIVFPTEDIETLKDSLNTDSEIFKLLSGLLASDKAVEQNSRSMPNGLTVEETNSKTFTTTENLYKNAFSKGIAMYYQDERSNAPQEFVRANPDGSEDLVKFDLPTRSYSIIKKLVPADEGRWAYLL